VAQVQGLVLEIILDLGIDDRRLPALQQRHFFREDVQGHHLMVLGRQDGIGKSDMAGTGDGNLHLSSLSRSRQGYSARNTPGGHILARTPGKADLHPSIKSGHCFSIISVR
jgi:hypothetical protein